jgi:hypothetical protein
MLVCGLAEQSAALADVRQACHAASYLESFLLSFFSKKRTGTVPARS